MAKRKQKKIELLSVTYKVDDKIHSASIHTDTLAASNSPLNLDSIIDHNETLCGPDCKCVDGIVWRRSTFGGTDHWMKTNESC